jgi:hypothetical protein
MSWRGCVYPGGSPEDMRLGRLVCLEGLCIPGRNLGGFRRPGGLECLREDV